MLAYYSELVTRSRLMQPKLAPVTLLVRGVQDTTTEQPYANAYIPPIVSTSGIERDEGAPAAEVEIKIYQEGEEIAPVVDYKIRDASNHEWLILRITTRLNFKPNWGIHECKVRRTI